MSCLDFIYTSTDDAQCFLPNPKGWAFVLSPPDSDTLRKNREKNLYTAVTLLKLWESLWSVLLYEYLGMLRIQNWKLILKLHIISNSRDGLQQTREKKKKKQKWSETGSLKPTLCW